MKRMNQILPVMVLLLMACGGGKTEKETEEKKAADTSAITESIRTNVSFLNDYNALEQLFSNDNWLIPGKKDSSYLYVSRVGNYTVNTYAYKLSKGDSASVEHNNIGMEKNQLVWQFNGQKLYLSSASRARAVWAVAGSDSAKYEFVRVDDGRISIICPDKTKLQLKKMLPFSLFLVRSRYDFTNGTKYAFDTSKQTKP